MLRKKTDSKKGFTIIEVVLVLAIAGLIFLMVFIALPNLQRTQRDTERKNDVDRLQTSLIQYTTNNNKTPSFSNASNKVGPFAVSDTNLNSGDGAWQKFAKNYLLANGQDEFNDPNGDPYNIVALTYSNDNIQQTYLDKFGGNTDNTSTALIVIVTGAKCGPTPEENTFEAMSGSRRFAVAVRLEGGGTYCVNN